MHQCNFIKQNGLRCRKSIVCFSDLYCHLHDPRSCRQSSFSRETLGKSPLRCRKASKRCQQERKRSRKLASLVASLSEASRVPYASPRLYASAPSAPYHPPVSRRYSSPIPSDREAPPVREISPLRDPPMRSRASSFSKTFPTYYA